MSLVPGGVQENGMRGEGRGEGEREGRRRVSNVITLRGALRAFHLLVGLFWHGKCQHWLYFV